ncbi:winged helix-turn-helix transcriptional regulator [Streptomyces sp. NRRL F-5630]|uniref:winged helix-turn-helix transcriptional regulator n=1 Tax=Streptomyces sp. NRRL F-5630 TaxID=1463864 RepID=UPI003EB9F30A
MSNEALFEHDTDAACEVLSAPLADVMTLLGRRWAGTILSTLLQGALHFNELKRAIPGVSDRVLTERLTEFVALGLVERTVIDAKPQRVRYELTTHGEALRPAINELTRWAREHLTATH